MSNLPPPVLPPPPPLTTWPGRSRGLPPAGAGSIATMAERIGARLIDLVVVSVGFALLSGVEAALRALSGVEASEDGDALSTILGFATLGWVFAYEAAATRKLGGTLGKKALGLRVVGQGLGPAGAIAVGGRAVVQFFLWALCILPGLLDIVAGNGDPDRRTWHDRMFGTLVLKTKGAAPESSSTVTIEPWRSLLLEARAARDRFIASTARAANGPLGERLKELRRNVDSCVTECERAASRGQELSGLVRMGDARAARGRADAASADAAASPDRRDLHVLAQARSSEAESAERLEGLVGRTEGSVQVLVAQLNDAVNRAIELAFTAPAPESLDDLVMQLQALQAAFADAETAFDSPR